MSTGQSAWTIRKLKSIYPFYTPSNFAPSNLTTEKNQIGLFNGRRGDSLLNVSHPLHVIEARNVMTRRLSSALPTLYSQADYGRKLVGSA